jgi:hypothetical protein
VYGELRSDLESFHLETGCTAFEGSQRVFSRVWTFSAPRDLV